MTKDEQCRVYCNHCEETIAKGSTLSDAMAKFFWELTKNNMDDTEDKICEDAAGDLSFSDLESAFHRSDYEIQFGTRQIKTETEIEWRPIDE